MVTFSPRGPPNLPNVQLDNAHRDVWWLTLQVQQGERKLTAQIKTLERHLENERQVQKNLQTYTSEIEETLKTSTEESQKQVSGVPAATVKLQPRLKA